MLMLYLCFHLLGLAVPSAALPKGLVSPSWSKLGIWKSCDNMWCAFGFVCVMHKSDKYEGPLCVKGGSLTCASVDCFPPAQCIHVETNDCDKPPCAPVTNCVAPSDHTVPPPTEKICSKVKCAPDLFCIVDDEGNGKCVRDFNCATDSSYCKIACVEGFHPADTPNGLQCVPVSVKTPPPNEYCPRKCVVGSHCEIVPQGPRCIPDKITCGEHETKEICGSLCEGKCSTANSGPQECPDICITPACTCDDNFYRNDQGKCVSKEQCGGIYTNVCGAFCPVGTCVQENGKAKCVSVSEDRPYFK